MPMPAPTMPRLRLLGADIKLGITALLITMLMGMAASMQHIVNHYEPRDQQPGLSRNDLASAYHGLNAPSSLLSALERNHPEDLAPDARDILISWLKGPRINEDYDNIDLGDNAPAELIATNCLSCHSRTAADADAAARAIPLDYWDDIKRIAFSREIAPVPTKITAVSTHTHALSLSAMSLILALLAAMATLPRRLTGALVMITGLALTADIASWWAARWSPIFVDVIIAAGTIYAAGTTVLILLIMLDLWLPKKQATTT